MNFLRSVVHTLRSFSRRLDDPELGELRFEHVVGWYAPNCPFGDAGGSVVVYLGGSDRRNPPGRILRAWVRDVEKQASALLEAVAPLVFAELTSIRGARRRTASDLRITGFETWEPENPFECWLVYVAVPAEGAAFTVRMEEWRPVEVDGPEVGQESASEVSDHTAADLDEVGLVRMGPSPVEELLTDKVDDRTIFWAVVPFGMVMVGLFALVLSLGPHADLPLVDAYAQLKGGMRAAFVGGAGAMLAGLGLAIAGFGRFERRRRRRAREWVSRREDAVVVPDDTTATYVEVVDPGNDRRTPVDVGWMTWDETRGVLSFEGVRERWLLPRSRIAGAALETVETWAHSSAGGGKSTWKRVALKIGAPGQTAVDRAFVPMGRLGADVRRSRAISRSLGD